MPIDPKCGSDPKSDVGTRNMGIDARSTVEVLKLPGEEQKLLIITDLYSGSGCC